MYDKLIHNIIKQNNKVIKKNADDFDWKLIVN